MPDSMNQPAVKPDRERVVVPVPHRCTLGQQDRHARERGWDKDPLYVMNDCQCSACRAERGDQPAAA